MKSKNKNIKQTDVIIVGAGPTGLMMANQLERFGVDYIILDKKPATVPESRAMGVQARTLEFYYQIGIGDEAAELGHESKTAQIFDDNGERVGFDFASKYNGKPTRYPFLLDLEQNKNEVVLLKNLKSKKSIYFDSTVTGVGQDKDKTWVKFTKNKKDHYVEGKYMVACDGASSIVRRTFNLDFAGKRYDNDFLVMDIFGKFKWDVKGIGITIKNDTVGLVFKLKEKNKYRLFAVIPHGEAVEKTKQEAKEIMLDNFPKGLEIEKVKWHSFYHVSSRMLEKFDLGRIYFAGDSAHIHSPAGGQGMNTGIGDSVNLGWKLAYVLQNKAKPDLLDTYSLERTRFAKGLLKTTDRAFSVLIHRNTFSKFSLNYIMPLIFGALNKFSFLQTVFFQRISQIDINHHTSTISNGKLGKLRGGDRLPYFEFMDESGKKINSFDKMKTTNHVLFYFGNQELDNDENNLDIVRIDDQNVRDRLGIYKDSYMFVRPDMYIRDCGIV